MKMNRKTRFPRRWEFIVGLCVAFVAHAVGAATTVPPKPLLVADGVAPNILFILDDSGSMNFVKMPESVSASDDLARNYGATMGLDDNPSDRSYVNNTIYYDPSRNYQPWATAAFPVAGRMANASISNLTTSLTDASGGGRNLVNHIDSVFYVPRQGVTEPGTSAGNYDRYMVLRSQAAPDGEVVLTGSATGTSRSVDITLYSGPVPNVSSGGSEVNTVITVPAGTTGLEVTLSGGRGDARLRVYRPGSNNHSCEQFRNGGDTATCTLSSSILSGRRNIGIARSTGQSVTDAHLTATATVTLTTTPARPTGRTNAAELQNLANWYQYHRTRMKVAKAGASEAFSGLGANYRVGFDTIWNGGADEAGRKGSVPVYPIPWSSNSGRFENVNGVGNRQDWFTRLQSATASGNTPLHGALDRAGRYYGTADPWKDGGGTELACRQGYSILTSDGYWNQNNATSGFTTDVGNADGDQWTGTLADVAMHYWNRDLRPNLPDKVPTPDRGETYQHMVTFGVSIGLGGTLDPSQDPPPAKNSTVWPDPISNSGAERIDDLWHAALNTGGKFIVANDGEAFANGLRSALSEIRGRSMSGGGITTNSSRLDEDRRTFLGSFDSGDWSGNVTAYVTAGASATPVAWSYASANNAGAVDFKDGTVLTSVGASNVGKYFSTTAPSNGLTAAEITGLARATGDAQVTALQNLAYLRGDSQLERRKGGQLRNRTSPVGDIVNSSPFFERETNTLYVGSNDGFLHAMSGQDGTPRFRYMPRGVNLEQLGRLSDPAYGSDDQTHPHRYFVDGNIHVSPKLVSRALDKNFLLGAMGRGGKGVFLLDVTNPTAMGPSQVLWDRTFQGTTGPSTDESTHMGMVLGESVILKDDYDLTSGNQDNRFSGHTIAIVPNGINSQSGSAVLFIYRLGANGAIIGSPVVLDTQTTNNGMTSIGAVDTNGNGRVDTIYGGDLRGNIWKFVMEGEAWKFAHRPNNGAAQPMFTAVGPTGAAQAITSGIAAKREPASGKMMLTFGTGRYISADDVTSTAVQTVYAVVDHANARITGGRSALQQRTFPMHGTIDGRAVRSLEGWPLNGLRYLETKSGWFLDLGVPMAGERVIARPQIYGDMLAIGTLIPRPSNDPCDQGRTTGFTILANVFTGTNPKATGGGTGSYYGDGTVTVPGAGGGENAFVGSQQSDVGGIGGIRITSTQVIAGGMDAQIEPTNWNNPSSSTPKRISWREIVGNN